MNSDSAPAGQELFLLADHFDEAERNVPVDPAAREVMEREVSAKLMARAAPERREAVRMLIEESDAVGGVWAYPGDPEMARLFAQLYALRNASTTALGTDRRVMIARRSSVEVTVALVDSFTWRGIVARVTRDPGQFGRNVVFVSRQSLSVGHIEAGLDAVSRSRRTQGDYPAKRTVVLVKPPRAKGDGAGRFSSLATQALAQLKLGTLREDLSTLTALPVAKVILPPEVED